MPCDLVGVAGFEPAASSSRSKHRTPGTWPLRPCDQHRQCIRVPWRTPVILAVVTQLVTQPDRGSSPSSSGKISSIAVAPSWITGRIWNR